MTRTAGDSETARATLHRYARAVDTRDEVALAEVFTEDVAFERADGLREGRDAVIAFYRTVFEGPTLWSKHMITNVLAEPHGDGLAVTAYFQAVSRTADDALAVFGEYDDWLVSGEHGLRVARKRIDVQQVFGLEPRHV